MCRQLLALKGSLLKLDQYFILPFNFERSLPMLVSIASESPENALLLTKAISGSERGFFQLAYTIMDAFPTSENIRSTLSSNAVYQTGDGVEWSFTEALVAIESEIANPKTPTQHVAWLNELKQKIERAPPRFSSLKRRTTTSWGGVETFDTAFKPCFAFFAC
jgi:hypothetical protein